MKTRSLLILLSITFIVVCGCDCASIQGTIVALYAGGGTFEACVIASQNMFEWMGYEVLLVDEEYINAGDFEGVGVLVFPGGFYEQGFAPSAVENVQNFIADGGVYIGTCGGAYIAGQRIIWLGNESDGIFNLFPGTAEGPVDDIYEYPTYGMCRVNFSDHAITQGLGDSCWIMYYWGPMFTSFDPADVDTIGTYDDNGDVAMVAFEYGEGRVFLTGPHPEWEEDSDRDGIDEFDDFDDQGSDWDLMREVVEWGFGGD